MRVRLLTSMYARCIARSMCIQLTPALQSKLQKFERQYAAFEKARPSINEGNVLEFISEQRRAHTHRPALPSEQLANFPPVVKKWLVVHNTQPSSKALLSHPAVRRSIDPEDIALIDDLILRFHGRVVKLSQAEAILFNDAYSKAFPADLPYQAGLQKHILKQVESGSNVLL